MAATCVSVRAAQCGQVPQRGTELNCPLRIASKRDRFTTDLSRAAINAAQRLAAE